MADLAVLERMKAYASEERLKEVKRKMEELRRQNTLERQKLQALLQQHEEELDRQVSEEEERNANGQASPGTPTSAFIGNRGGPAKLQASGSSSPLVGTPPPISPKSDVTSSADRFRTNLAAAAAPRGSGASSPTPAITKGFSPQVAQRTMGGAGAGSPLNRSHNQLIPPVENSNPLSNSQPAIFTNGEGSGDLSASTPSVTSDEKRAKRAHIILEIINTEHAYIDFLTVWIDEYMKPLQRDSTISKDDFTLIFANIDQLLPINIELYKQMKEMQLGAAETYDIMLGDLFIRSADLFKIYTLYFTNNASATQTTDRLILENKMFAEFLEIQQFKNGRTRGLTFHMFMIMPIQRLCRYPLLLRELIKATPESHPDWNPLQKAVEAIERTVAFLNEKKRDREALQKVVDVCRSLEGVDEGQFILPTRRHIMDQQLGLLSNKLVKKRHVFLFNDLIVVTKPKPASNPPRFICKSQQSLAAVRVIDIADRDGFCYMLGIAPKDNMDPAAQTSFLCSSPEEKEKWLGQLKKLIKEFQLRLMAEKAKNAVTPLEVLRSLPSNSSLGKQGTSPSLLSPGGKGKH